jgi:uncharacterized protein (DUF2249 family)
MNPTPLRLDVREDIRNGREPFAKIMNAVAGLGAAEQLLLVTPFEPVPMVHMLRKNGFRHASRKTEGGDWEVLFTREAAAERETTAPGASMPGMPPSSLPASVLALEVDARGLEPPMPMVTILEAVAALPKGAELRARTDRRPMHLYAQLEERGFTGQTEEQTDGSYLTLITRR